MNRPFAHRSQRGVTLIGLMSWAVVVGFIGYVLVRTVPTLLEYQAIQKAINNIAASPPPTVVGIRNAFERQKEIEYSIESIGGGDLEITKEEGKVVIRFAYQKEVELIKPVYLLIKYEGRSQ
ncbi:DUF4845 domain-containing protein [Aquincola sp. S2]|uniref:DUF4845 domain-containing protein n=1 Tax=Pseudaquabacterium terrae TaxID=2732868 RepID=A0ABX2EE09_9BURK|nr:DUF4845 domain-containing protein [Aquabacterium terrae]NRF66845.1 DUF4845 domain-containing protein [Aquabacterium terrae]